MVRVIVVGGGVSGLSTAFYIEKKAKEAGKKIELTVLESSKRLGGKAWTYEEEGFACESGVNGFLDNKPSTLELCSDIGISDELLPSNDSARKRFIYSDGRLQRLPESPLTFFTSSLLSVKGRLRVMMEPFTRPAPKGKGETVTEFAARHMGMEAVDKLVGPMVSGVYAGDPDTLSVESCFPLLLDVERAGGGSLIKGMIKKMKAAKRAGKDAKASTGPGGKLTSFRPGMSFMIDSLKAAIEGEVLKGKPVERISVDGGSYKVYIQGRAEPLEAEAVVLAVPAYVGGKILKDFDLSGELTGITYEPLSVVCLGYKREDIEHPLDGFGYLITKKEKRKILGSLWDTSVFIERSPEGYFLIRSMVGGAVTPEYALMPEEELIKTVRGELKDIMGIDAEPVFSKVFVHEKAIPQYLIGHNERLDRIEKSLERYPGLFLTGNAFRGIGINDCTKNAALIAEKVAAYLDSIAGVR